MKCGGKPVHVGLAMGLLLAGASGAQATMYDFPGGYFTGGDSGQSGYDYSNISQAPAGYANAVTGTVLTGGDALVPNAGGATLDAYCVDLSHYLFIGTNPVDYNLLSDSASAAVNYFSSLYTGANGAAIVTSLEHLASNALSQVNNADTSAAFQIAVWDIAFGAANGSGFSVTANGADASTVNGDVTTFLNLAAQGGAITQRLTFLQDDGTNNGSIQDLVTFNPVPLPAGLWLMISGLGVLGSVMRLRPTRITPG
jgi:hypothetical protein